MVVSGRRAARTLREALPLLPFGIVVAVFLIIPTVTVLIGAVYADGVFTLDRIAALFTGTALSALANSLLLSGISALVGAGLVDQQRCAHVDGATGGAGAL